MWNNLFKHIDVLAENVHLLDGNAADLDYECREYERKIKEAGGIELFVGGKKSVMIRLDNHRCSSYFYHSIDCM